VKVRLQAPPGASVAMGGGGVGRSSSTCSSGTWSGGPRLPYGASHLRPGNRRCAGDRAGGCGCPPVPARNDIAAQGAMAVALETARAAG